MKKGMYRLSLCLTLGVFIFLLMKGIGFIFWINGGLLDKWIAIIGLVTALYLFLNPKKGTLKIVQKLMIGSILFHAVWLWWSVEYQQYEYAYAGKNQMLSTPYVIHQATNWGFSLESRDITNTYILYKSVTPFLFMRVSIKASEPRLVNRINLSNWKGTKIDDYELKRLLDK
ncbi:hypothetical protein [Priestia endophytica]|uniref:hypothetical protein n=1 Tax=Priestia endophytica TaxID=135735 RepID=UPI002E1D974F|nr:hypothetical protein [Priestia endophytica]